MTAAAQTTHNARKGRRQPSADRMASEGVGVERRLRSRPRGGRRGRTGRRGRLDHAWRRRGWRRCGSWGRRRRECCWLRRWRRWGRLHGRRGRRWGLRRRCRARGHDGLRRRRRGGGGAWRDGLSVRDARTSGCGGRVVASSREPDRGEREHHETQRGHTPQDEGLASPGSARREGRGLLGRCDLDREQRDRGERRRRAWGRGPRRGRRRRGGLPEVDGGREVGSAGHRARGIVGLQLGGRDRDRLRVGHREVEGFRGGTGGSGRRRLRQRRCGRERNPGRTRPPQTPAPAEPRCRVRRRAARTRAPRPRPPRLECRGPRERTRSPRRASAVRATAPWPARPGAARAKVSPCRAEGTGRQRSRPATRCAPSRAPRIALRANAAAVDAGASFSPAALRSSAASAAAVGHRSSGDADRAFAATATSPLAHAALRPGPWPAAAAPAARASVGRRVGIGSVSRRLPLSASQSSTPAPKTSARASYGSPRGTSGARCRTDAGSGCAPGRTTRDRVEHARDRRRGRGRSSRETAPRARASSAAAWRRAGCGAPRRRPGRRRSRAARSPAGACRSARAPRASRPRRTRRTTTTSCPRGCTTSRTRGRFGLASVAIRRASRDEVCSPPCRPARRPRSARRPRACGLPPGADAGLPHDVGGLGPRAELSHELVRREEPLGERRSGRPETRRVRLSPRDQARRALVRHNRARSAAITARAYRLPGTPGARACVQAGTPGAAGPDEAGVAAADHPPARSSATRTIFMSRANSREHLAADAAGRAGARTRGHHDAGHRVAVARRHHRGDGRCARRTSSPRRSRSRRCTPRTRRPPRVRSAAPTR